MEDSNLWYYLALGIIYFISKAFGKKKPKKGVPQQQADPGSQPEPSPIEFSFEDILKELTGQKSTPKQPQQPVLETIEVEPQMASSTQPGSYSNSPAYSSDEMDMIASAPIQSTYSKGLEAAPKRERRQTDSFTREGSYKIEEVESVDYLELLQEENGPARAFVMSEIFTKKY